MKPELPSSTEQFRIPTVDEVREALRHLPDAKEIDFERLESAVVGNVSAVYAGWGEKRNSQDILRQSTQQNSLSKDIEDMVNNVGFDHGYYYADDIDIFQPIEQAKHAQYAARLAHEAARLRGTHTIDQLVFASVSSIPEIGNLAKAILQSWGYDVGPVTFYGQACNGMIAAIMDSTRLAQETGDAGVHVVVGLESLSGSHVQRDDIKVRRTFGNGGGAIAFVPGKDLIHITGQTLVKADDASITVPRVYELPTDHLLAPYPWYTIDESAKKRFVRTPTSSVLQMYEPEQTYATMHGGKTIKFFTRNTPPVIMNVLEEYQQYYAKTYGPIDRFIQAHQPSKPVIESLNRHLEKIHESYPTITPHGLHIPWTMQEAGMNNISAGTYAVSFVENIKSGSLKTDTITLSLGMGVGAVIQCDVFLIPKT